jgi:hypothetical protein
LGGNGLNQGEFTALPSGRRIGRPCWKATRKEPSTWWRGWLRGILHGALRQSKR